VNLGQHNGSNLWLESDSSLVVKAFNNLSLVPCQLRNRWKNCLLTLSSMNFLVSHVYREGNQCDDLLGNLGLSSSTLTVWLDMPICIRQIFGKYKLDMPNFRFVNT